MGVLRLVSALMLVWLSASLETPSAVVLALPPQNGHDSTDSESVLDYEEETQILEPLNARGTMSKSDRVPQQLSGIEEVTKMYTVNGDLRHTDNKVIAPNLLEHADRAMLYVTRVYNRMEKYNHMFAGKHEELDMTLDRYARMLTLMLEDKKKLKHLSFVRRYLSHVNHVKAGVSASEEARTNLMREAGTIYQRVQESFATIKLDFERYYSLPGVVINGAVSSLIGIGEAYKMLVKLNDQMFSATDAFRTSLNRMRASSIYMFAYLLCLDILYTEILPLRMLAVQDVIVTKGTAETLISYHTNIANKREAIKALLKNGALDDKAYDEIEDIYRKVSELYERSKAIHKRTIRLLDGIEKKGTRTLENGISRVVNAWETHYKRPVLMCTKLTEEHNELNKIANNIKEERNFVHTNKQSLYTMSTLCNELYSRARELAHLGKDGVRPVGHNGYERLYPSLQTYRPRTVVDNSEFTYAPPVQPPSMILPKISSSENLMPDILTQGMKKTDKPGFSHARNHVPPSNGSSNGEVSHAYQSLKRKRPLGSDQYEEPKKLRSDDPTRPGYYIRPSGIDDGSDISQPTYDYSAPYRGPHPPETSYESSQTPQSSTHSTATETDVNDADAYTASRGSSINEQGSPLGVSERTMHDVSTSTKHHVHLPHPMKRDGATYDNDIGFDLSSVLEKLREAENKVTAYRNVILSLRRKPPSVPGAHEARLISMELYKLHILHRSFVDDATEQ
ncbi:hypothetical protein, conserved [Babesia bigemina]|uniref:Uncharacterized protein n=1 Tax=Babesia bigemina TaxID=5866 RepID=A0A061D5W0_BABBI|nr:hypothetical protein, conserved [Babesia bigemina]CDR95402.1 hypothetical protein, conserved [Babesia bigemina]|eukprot:XP_012767588.1 hypothetical protein, conserved [Babesia bigemina]